MRIAQHAAADAENQASVAPDQGREGVVVVPGRKPSQQELIAQVAAVVGGQPFTNVA
jgi:hypothetical protein